LKVSIVGASGYGGLELIRILKNHPHMEIASLHTSSQVGQLISKEYRHLAHVNDKLEEIDPVEISKSAEIVFLAAPTGVSKELVPALYELGVKVIDLSGDLRLKDPAVYEKWYKHAPAEHRILEKSIYGLSEWNRDLVKNADIIANPGCYPTAALLGLGPLFAEGVAHGADVIIDAKSGISGAGKTPSAGTHYSEINENFKIYKVHQHQHIPEIEQQLNQWSDGLDPVTFSTHLVPMTRGIMATMYLKLKSESSTDRLLELYNSVYDNHPFVRVQPTNAFPCTKQVYGSNFCDIAIAFDERTNKATIVSVIDNLMKGAAGQAVQNANIMIGAEETAGLLNIPLYP
jgi:N-acetyl-gamma-glutamyl-phosphate reductase